MTVVKVAWLNCDICNEPSGDGSLGESLSVAEARESARRDDWHHTKDGRDICPDCWEGGAR